MLGQQQACSCMILFFLDQAVTSHLLPTISSFASWSTMLITDGPLRLSDHAVH
jgi:hypothetical protein